MAIYYLYIRYIYMLYVLPEINRDKVVINGNAMEIMPKYYINQPSWDMFMGLYWKYNGGEWGFMMMNG